MTLPSKISVVIVDDHSLFRMGVVQALAQWKAVRVAGEGATAHDAVELVRKHDPNIVLLDISMPGGGIAAARSLRGLYPDPKIIMLTVSEEHDDVLEAFDAGAVGYVLKGSSGEELMNAIAAIMQGQSYLSPRMGMPLYTAFRGKFEAERLNSLIKSLTSKELSVLKLLGKGLSNPEISEASGIHLKTVKFNVSKILSKLKVKNRTEAALLIKQSGLL